MKGIDIQTWQGKQRAMAIAPKNKRNRIANAAWSPKSKTKAQIAREKTIMNNNRKAKKS
jgi:hypothetical protein